MVIDWCAVVEDDFEAGGGFGGWVEITGFQDLSRLVDNNSSNGRGSIVRVSGYHMLWWQTD